LFLARPARQATLHGPQPWTRPLQSWVAFAVAQLPASINVGTITQSGLSGLISSPATGRLLPVGASAVAKQSFIRRRQHALLAGRSVQSAAVWVKKAVKKMGNAPMAAVTRITAQLATTRIRQESGRVVLVAARIDCCFANNRPSFRCLVSRPASFDHDPQHPPFPQR
jgi:hypothetical protein